MMFHENQKRAIEHIDGPAIVLAGPGSGKTTVIVERVKNLIKKQIPPEKILVVTFTKAAAMNMKQRFCNAEKDLIGKTYPVTFGTFHSIFFQMLKDTYRYDKDAIISEQQKMDYVKQCIIKLKIDTLSMADYLNGAISEIGKVKTNRIKIDEYESIVCGKEDFRRVYKEYVKCLKAEKKLDFDDILYETYQMFYNYPEILRKWQEIYEYILIDEFQDINLLQYEVIKLLAKEKQNLFIVGDDDQSIYGFRGSRPDIMLHFKDDYPLAKEIYLNINYRSSEKIVAGANKLIERNKIRYDKDIIANKSGGNNVSIRKFKRQGDEISYIVKQIQRLLKKGIPPGEIAILVRNNSQIPVFRTALTNNGIGSQYKKNNNSVYTGMVFKDIFAYINSALSMEKKYLNENADFVYILNKPQRFISRECVLEEKMTLDKLESFYLHHAEIYQNIQNLKFHMQMIAKLNPYAAINYIRKGAEYEKYLFQYAKEHQIKPVHLMKQLDTIHQDAYQYTNYRKWFEFIHERQNETVNENDGVNLLTMHGAKGLEFHTVIIADANQGIIPSKRTLREKQFEEERRVFYVAMTRAREQLCIYATLESLGNQQDVSMFVTELVDD